MDVSATWIEAYHQILMLAIIMGGVMALNATKQIVSKIIHRSYHVVCYIEDISSHTHKISFPILLGDQNIFWNLSGSC